MTPQAVLNVPDSSDAELLLLAAAVSAAALAVGLVLVSVVRRIATRLHVTVLSGRLWHSPLVAIVVLEAADAVMRRGDRPWSSVVSDLLWVAQLAAVAWLLVVLVLTLEKAALAKYPDTGLSAGSSRHVRTKITLVRRIAVAGIVTIAIGVLLWSIPEVRTLGITVLASAGVLGIIAGLAAQTSLSNIFAGIQIAFTDGIRIGDIVVIEDTWGTIDEITLTYVSVEVWDGTSLILPCTYFTTTPFQNWTHTGAAVQGEVVLAVDWATDISRIRDELARVLAASSSWDGQRGELVVDDASGPALRLVAFVSAADGEALGRLRWEVREALVRHVQDHQPDAITRARADIRQEPAVQSAAQDPASHHQGRPPH